MELASVCVCVPDSVVVQFVWHVGLAFDRLVVMLYARSLTSVLYSLAAYTVEQNH